MKNIMKSCLCMALFVSLLINNSLNAIAEDQTNDIGILYGTEYIVDGKENVTVNDDGTWTVTGDFVLSFPVYYDYRMEEYMWDFGAISDGTYELEVDFFIPKGLSDETVTCTALLVEPEISSGDIFIVWSFEDFYIAQGFASLYPWNYQIQCSTLTYRAKSAQTTTITWFQFSTPDYTPTFGDVNRNGEVNTADVRELLLATIDSTSGSHLRGIDIDGNGVFDTSDARALLSYVVS